MTLKVFEAFAGIGTQRMALRNLGIAHEVVAISEIDKHALKSYEAIHGEVNNLGDISKIKIDDIPNCDLFTYSFPCQDISVAGLGKGLAQGTRSSLLWECERIISAKKPKYLLMENVKNLVGKKFRADFEKWLAILESYGYKNYWQVLNAKDYGVPQNRERVFCVSILGEYKDYELPKGKELNLRLKDILENEVDEKYYLSQQAINMLTKEDTGKFPRKQRFLDNLSQNRNIARAILSRQRTSPTDTYIVTTVKEGSGVLAMNNEEVSLRKLTPKECWRLMGIPDEDFNKAQEVNSNTQLYKQAGNAIVVDVLEAIFRQLFLKGDFK